MGGKSNNKDGGGGGPAAAALPPPAQSVHPPVAARKFWKLQKYFPGPGSYRGRLDGRYESNYQRVTVRVGGGQMLWAAARVHAFGGRIDRGGSASAAEKRRAGRIRLTTTRPVRGSSSLGSRDPPESLC